ncbi:hypothetical protein E1A91_D09G234000v1 [Gossypium mustelinum]|uniref:Uncharacterized protein n=1 Tax=Gossypium mustelinum TaxID=34275 RepID=A0A5D2TMV7_GOSMU|nr:hypothetical protein E1A91_D09G234000v1 [Gossypium mustelinum]
MDFIHQLLLRGLKVTSKNLHFLNPILSFHSSSNNGQTLVLPFSSHPSIPFGVENLQDVPISFVPYFVEAMAQLYDLLFQWFQTNPSPPVAISFRGYPCPFNINFAARSLLPSLRSWGHHFQYVFGEDSDKMEIIKEEFTNHDRIWAVGPLLPIKATNNERGAPSSIPRDQVIEWLDSCNRDNSRRFHFIWGIEGDSQNLVPLGFEKRLAGKGLMIRGWVPQQAIMGHRAVGSYLTHCGWNSAVEGLLGGALLQAWPMQVDHFDNTNLLIDELGVAIRASEGLITVPDSNKLAQVLSEPVSADRPERVRAMKLRQVGLDAIPKGGS